MAENKQVLVLEPANISGWRIRRTLTEQGFEVIEHAKPRDAIADIRKARPALVFLSTAYGEDATFRLCHKLAQYGFCVVLIDANPTHENVLRAIRNGAFDILVQPLNESTIAARVQAAIDRSGIARAEGRSVSRIQIPDELQDPKDRVEYVIKHACETLALPHAVSAVLRLSRRSDVGAADLARPIESDSALTASVFRVANSAAAAARARITDLSAAVTRLGTKQIVQIAMAQSVFTSFKRTGETFGFDRSEYWIHSLGSACCARTLADCWGEADPDDAFLAGLLHDIGKMVLDEYLPQDYQRVVHQANVKGLPVAAVEEKVLGLGHGEVGREVCHHWGLPEALCQAVGIHHDHQRLLNGDVENEAGNLGRCACLADQLAKAFGLGHAGDFLVVSDALALWNCLGDIRLDLREVFRRAYGELHGFLELLQIPCDHLPAPSACLEPPCVLLSLAREAENYRRPLEAFFTRFGYVTRAVKPEDVEKDSGSHFVLGVAGLPGSIEDVTRAAQRLERCIPSGILFTDAPLEPGAPITPRIRASSLKRPLDFYSLSEYIDGNVAANGS
ncbi:MAG TPA: response regulator [Candidatus Hydrogenedentes bacterium]|nr:response regulator [Candidatus Hydrogenedentota bacterium]HPG69481.1 response regulator [Candidatus Hydrogenedentota bacterium]